MKMCVRVTLSLSLTYSFTLSLTQLSAVVISQESLVAVVMVPIVSEATLGQRDTDVTIQEEPRVTLTSLYTNCCAGP